MGSEVPVLQNDLSRNAPATGVPGPTGAQPKRLRLHIFTGAVFAVILVLAAWPAYKWWCGHRAEQYRTACKAATEEKQWGRLQGIAEKWLDWDPQSNDAHVFMAEAHFQAGRLDEAADSLERVADDYHNIVPVLIFRGEILHGDLHRAYEAEANWQRILKIDPENTHAHQRLILFYAMSLQRDKMVRQIRDSLRRRCEPPEAYAYLLLANALGFTDGLVHVSNWRKHYPGDETLEVAEAIYAAKYKETTVADAFEKSHVAAGDQTAINACLEKYPHNVEVLAFHLERETYYGNAAKVLELLKSAPPEAMLDSRFWRYRAWLFQQTKEHQKALEALRKSIQIDSFAWRSRWEMATVLRQSGQRAVAEDVQELAMQGKVLQDKLYETDGRALTWGLVEEMRHYVSQVDAPAVLDALDSRIRRQGGEGTAAELLKSSADSPKRTP